MEEEHIRPQLDNLVMDKKLVIKGGLVYAASYYYAELNCAHMLHQLNIPMHQEEAHVQEVLKVIAGEVGVRLDELQYRAVLEAIQSGLFVLSGGPGTGKTTTINTIIRFFEREGYDIFLAAPTGRAAKRMTEATGFEARTIHRMLELNGALSDEDKRRARFERNEENPLRRMW